MNLPSAKPARALALVATIGLIFVGCTGGGGASDPATGPTSAPGAPASAAPTGGDASPDSPPAATPGTVDAGPAAAPGEGRLDVNGTSYALTITECEFTDDGPTKGTFEVRGTGPDGATFEMTQFFLSDKWSQTSVQLDFGPTNIYVIRSGTREGAVPAAVDEANITWIESYRDLDVAANSQVDLGQGVLNLTCP